MRNKSKTIYLAGGSEERFRWVLLFDVSSDQRKWKGNFVLSSTPKRAKNIYLAGGADNWWQWRLYLHIFAKEQRRWGGTFTFAGETQKYREQKRNADNKWANKVFPRCWKQQFEIHHDWNGGETCYFLTPEAHREIEKAQA